MKNKTHKILVDLIVAFVLGVASGSAHEYLSYGRIDVSLLFFVRIVILTILYTFLFVILRKLLSINTNNEKSLKKLTILNFLFGKEVSAKKQVVAIAAIIFFLWLPYFIVSYPGNMSNDTTGQIPMFFSIFEEKSYGIQDQHPIFTTFVFGSIIYTANLLFKNMHVALAICILLQMVVTSLSFAFVFVWARRRWKISYVLELLMIAVVTILPLVPLMVISLSKDTFFSWIYILLLLSFFELVRTKFEIIKNRKFFIAFLILCVLACLTKKLAIYIVSGTLLLYIIFCGQSFKTRLKIAVPLVVSALLMWGIMPFIISHTPIYPSPTKEMLPLPFQQVALTYLRHEGELDESDVNRIDKVLDVSTIKERYAPANGDSIKGNVDDNSDFKDFLKLYLKLGLKYPTDYIDAYATQNAGLFTAYKIEPIFDNHWHTWNGDYMDEDFFEKPEFAAEQSEQLEEYYNWFSKLPILGVSTYTVTFVVFLTAFLLICLIRSKKHFYDLLPILPILASIFGMSLGSVVYWGNEGMRYVMPFVYTVPVVIFYCHQLLVNNSKIARNSILPSGKRRKAGSN